MTDVMDAFVREASASMDYVSRNQYFRRILEDGLQGSLRNGAKIINRATETVKDKMGSFTAVANDFNHSLRDVVQDIGQTVGSLGETAKTMELTVGVARQGSDSVISASDETSASVQTISSAAEEMSSSIAEISEQVTRTSTIAGKAVHELQESQERISELVHTAQKIGAVVQLIDEIAGQTNLLALNATIEAARAGDAGKGFAIVASEVKDLAGQTAKATEEISAQISSIQQATQKAASSFADLSRIIDEINQAATVVAAAVEEQSAASREIASSAEKASSATIEVAGNVREIGQGIGKIDNATGDVLSVTQKLTGDTTRKVEALQHKMNVFMDELRKIA
jgi:methyl-accepting chemotaxis protein